MIDHILLSKFRSKLSFEQLTDLMVYVLYHVYNSGLLSNFVIHGVDSTELANECSRPLASIKDNGKNIRVYSDLDCDCGKRRNKRDKSPDVIGYRLHTLTAMDAKTGHRFPLVSLLAPANHRDSHVLMFLIKLAQAMGIDLKLITADEACHDTDGAIHEQTGVLVATLAGANVNPPENVDISTHSVFFDGDCHIPMHHVGYEGIMHEHKCGLVD